MLNNEHTDHINSTMTQMHTQHYIHISYGFVHIPLKPQTHHYSCYINSVH